MRNAPCGSCRFESCHVHHTRGKTMKLEDIHDVESMEAIAKRLGKERTELEERNKRRRAKGRKPLPDDQEKADQEVLRMKYRTGDPTTVDGAQAIRMFEMRKAAMNGTLNDDDDDDDDEQPINGHIDNPPTTQTTQPPPPQPDQDAERARREAEAVRRVQDMKSGRIDHGSNWSPDGQKLEGGDDTTFPTTKQVWGNPFQEGDPATEQPSEPEKPSKGRKISAKAKSLMPVAAGLNEFQADLYERLRVSFEALETTLSDMQGRLNEVVTASAKAIHDESQATGSDEFEAMMARKSPVTFDVGGTKMTFDAVTVFHAPPCITVVSKAGSATIMPKPGARLNISYDMDGVRYDDDPVTFLGTRFDLPMFGLSFVGFIRDREADLIDAAAGVSEG